MKKWIWIGVVAVVAIFFYATYNGFVNREEGLKSAWSNVETQYQRRADLIPNLVNTVKGYAAHETQTLNEVTEARARATSINLSADDLTPERLAQFQRAQAEVRSALGRLIAVSESYPDLKANQNFLELQAQLEGTENRIAVARKDFNAAAQQYNVSVRRFPANLVARMFGFGQKPYFESAEGAAAAPQVTFLMISERSRGYVLGAIAAASYGLNPLFALPLYGAGLGVDSVLFYRYVLAVVMLGALMLFRRQSFALRRRDVLPLAAMGVLFSVSSLLLFESYNLMDAGIASTILFVYPVMVAVIMAVGFRERVTAATVVSIALACGGISLLYKGGDGATLNLAGVVLVFLSALSYAVWIVAVNRSSLKDLPTEKLTFYCLVFGSLVYVVRLRGCADLQPVPSPLMWVNAVALALFPTIVSLVAMAGAIRRIGSTPTAILGALEPVTALFFGVAVFGERFTLRIGTGVLLILVAVTLIIAGKSIRIPTSVTHLARWMARPRLPRWAVRWARRLPLPRIRRTR